jgi:hypothetical protein
MLMCLAVCAAHGQVLHAITVIFWILLSCLICSCLGLLLILLQRLASNLLTGWDVDQDGARPP